jgi:hypothetical protein
MALETTSTVEDLVAVTAVVYLDDEVVASTAQTEEQVAVSATVAINDTLVDTNVLALAGPKGDTGEGLTPGGSSGEFLIKTGADDYDADWFPFLNTMVPTDATHRWTTDTEKALWNADHLALGETELTAYRGDHGLAAYTHSLVVTGNPHNVTKGEVGLANANNTSDADKPISDDTQAALDLKLDIDTAAATYLPIQDLDDYLTTASAAATYLDSATAASTYLTIANAGATYLSSATAASVYQTQAGMSSYYDKTSSDVRYATPQSVGAVAGDLLSHTQLGDTAHGGIVYKTRLINGKALSADITLSTADIPDTSDRRYVTDAQKAIIGSGTVSAVTQANGLTLTAGTLALGAASTSTAGGLSATDWNTFNGKENAGICLKLDQSTPQTFTGTGFTGNGILKITGGTLGVDTNTYLTSLSGALLATGATTGATSQAQAFTLGVITGKIQPAADSTTAVQITKTDGTTAVMTVDTTNGSVICQGANYPVLQGIRTTTAVDGLGAAIDLTRKTSGNMVDTFGGGFVISIMDNAGVRNGIAGFYAGRDGADDKGRLSLNVNTGNGAGGAILSKMNIDSAGRVTVVSAATGLPGTSGAGKFNVIGDSDIVTQTVQTFAGQTADAWQAGNISGVTYAKVTPAGAVHAPNFLCLSDTGKLTLGAGSDMTVYYNGTSGFIDVSAGGASDLHIVTGADKTLVLDTVVYKDQLGAALSLQQTGSGISRNIPEGTVDYTTAANQADYMVENFQFNHDRKAGTPVYVHLHWLQAETNTPNWAIQYRWQLGNVAKTTSWTAAKWTSNAFTWTTGTLNQITTFAALTPASNEGVSPILQVRFLRDTTNALGLSFAADPYTATVAVIAVDAHYQIDTNGSRTEYSK